ncbi:hypothetical protein GA0061102_10354 [Rhizobium miluonense]|uniref:Glycine-rich domain-containing protein n=2 Tax=Rhizobium miluonense TaxID=411945 RepID=A0A1C3WNV1_9HYPH|nr:hypothetical protein GA0061102_10354 [Rhizobium miluonense]
MLYNQPLDQASNPNAPYVNGNPSSGIQGSIIPAAAVEYPQRELIALIQAAGFTPSNTDLAQVAKAIQSGLLNFAVAGGTAGALTASITPAPTALFAGLSVVIKTTLAASGATTLNLNSLGNKPVVWGDQTIPVANDWGAGSLLELRFDGASFQIQGISPSSIQTGRWNTATAGGTANALTATLTPAPAAVVVGFALDILISTTNTGAATLNLNGLGAKPIVTANGNVLSAGDLSAGRMVTLVYDGANFQMTSPPSAMGYTNLVTLSTSGTFTVPLGVSLIRVWLIGAGGGGGSSNTNDPAAGGAGAPCGMRTIRVTPGQAFPCVFGSGGNGGSSQGQGATGGTTTGFGMTITGSTGGFGAATSVTTRSGGAPGSVTGADITFPGQPGGLITGQTATSSGGVGGRAGGPYGGQAGIGGASTGGIPAAGNFGGGGGGAGPVIAVGGTASSGAVYIEY